VKAKEFRQRTDAELRDQLRRLRESLFQARAQKTTNQLANPHHMAQIRKDIARVLHVMSERETEA
jgi:large subunit ribosomal protein L29